jgi:hypothetical protein
MVLFRWRHVFGTVSPGIWILTFSLIVRLLTRIDVAVVLAMMVIL